MTIMWSIVAVVLLGFGYKAYKNTKDVFLRRERIGLAEHPEAPVLNVLHLSDMHLENISISPDELYDKLRGETIDIIALTGDFLDRKRTIPKLAPYLEALRKLEPAHGIYAVFGNHDYVLRPEAFQKLRKTFHQYGCRTLQNESDVVEIGGRRLHIIGIDDHCTGRSDLKKSFARATQHEYRLVLTHDPNVVLELDPYHYDYLLSGHFHGGQICWPKPYHLVKMGKLVRLNMIKGLHYAGGKPFYISEGLGQTGVNIRVGSRPEVTMHHLAITQGAMSRTAAG
ncbi:metallophosphoesterase [Paenibacillus sp.]|uniref:metallophosphoesterase n=1 Tax=Paenibacillus sp. TaxID=58172 RepID=UPI002D6F6DB7|nr:metallophosphoesterase [Paenibacillus sp.]HZG84738.1 metallophosphoesterase [Paenibacillus sp.]